MHRIFSTKFKLLIASPEKIGVQGILRLLLNGKPNTKWVSHQQQKEREREYQTPILILLTSIFILSAERLWCFLSVMSVNVTSSHTAKLQYCDYVLWESYPNAVLRTKTVLVLSYLLTPAFILLMVPIS